MISIIIPLYNKEKVIIKTLQSVRDQSYHNWECVIVDDGSKDDSAIVVKEFIKIDNRFSYFYKENGGPSSARNYGVKKAKGDWIVFLDADDRYEEDALAHFVSLLQKHKGYRMYCCNFYVEQDGDRGLYSDKYSDGVVVNNFRSWYFRTLMPCQGSTVYERKLLLEHPLNEQLRRFEDAGMLFDIMRTKKIYRSSHPTFTYVRENSAASGVRKNFQEDFFAHLEPKGKPFWEQMILYQYYKASFILYGDQARQVYQSSPFHPFMEFSIKMMIKWINIKSRLFKTLK